MRTPNLGTISYAPGEPPTDPTQLQRFLRDELQVLAAAITALARGHLDKSYKAPDKPRDGDLAYADGTSWNPGGGKGVYIHNGSVWTLIKAIT